MKVQPTTRQLIEMLYERLPELFDRVAPPAPVQEPVGEVGWGGTVNWHKSIPDFGTDLYTTPPAAQRQWVGLTDDAKLDLISDAKGIGGRVRSDAQSLVLLDMQEAKLKEKNT